MLGNIGVYYIVISFYSEPMIIQIKNEKIGSEGLRGLPKVSQQVKPRLCLGSSVFPILLFLLVVGGVAVCDLNVVGYKFQC